MLHKSELVDRLPREDHFKSTFDDLDNLGPQPRRLTVDNLEYVYPLANARILWGWLRGRDSTREW